MLEPIFDAQKIEGATVDKLRMQIRWHRLWNVEFRKPFAMKKKSELMEEVQKAVKQFKDERREVKEIQHLLERRS